MAYAIVLEYGIEYGIEYSRCYVVADRLFDSLSYVHCLASCFSMGGRQRARPFFYGLI
jgi:hypothetical protein